MKRARNDVRASRDTLADRPDAASPRPAGEPPHATPHRLVAWLALACACAATGGAVVVAQAATPSDDAGATHFNTPLTTHGPGPYYTLSLPMALQSSAGKPDLSDLRVVNATGEVLPLAWLPQRTTTDEARQVEATIYKVPAPPPAKASATTARSGRTSAPQAWIVDTHDSGTDLQRLELALAPGAQGVYTLQIEASDDLRHWRTVQADAQLVQLKQMAAAGKAPATRFDDAPLVSTGIDLDGVPARYLRLSAPDGEPAPEIASATVASTRRQTAEAPLQWSEPIAASSCEARHCDYPMPRNVPVEALQIVLADADVVTQVHVLGAAESTPVETAHHHHHHHLIRGPLHALRDKERARQDEEETRTRNTEVEWEEIGEADVYWLSHAGGARDVRSPPLRLDNPPWLSLRLETPGPTSLLGHVPPTLRVGAHPRSLVFLARGAAPYHLEQRSTEDSSPVMTLAQLMPTRAENDPLPAATATPESGAATRVVMTSPKRHAREVEPARGNPNWLWAVLLVELGLMGAMAWSLLRSPAANMPQPPQDDTRG